MHTLYPSIIMSFGQSARMSSSSSEEEEEEHLFPAQDDYVCSKQLHATLKKLTDDLKRRTISKKVPITIAHRVFPTHVSRSFFGIPAPNKTQPSLKIITAEIDAMDKYIKSELRERLTQNGIEYLENDPYGNVAKYINHTGLTNLNKIYPWLGKTDYNCDSGGSSKQKQNLFLKLKELKHSRKQLHHGGARNNSKSKLRKRTKKSHKMRRRTLRKHTLRK